MTFETLLLIAVCVLAAAVVVAGLMSGRLLLRARARSRQINAQMDELNQRLDRVDDFQETLQGLVERLRGEMSALEGRLDGRLDEVERVGLERHQAELAEIEGLHHALDRLDHLARHRVELERARTAVQRAVDQGRMDRDAGLALHLHLAEAGHALSREGLASGDEDEADAEDGS